MPRHPSSLLSWNADDEGVIGNVLGHDGAGGDEGVAADRDPADNRRVCTDRGAAADQGFLIQGMPDHLRTRIGNIGQDAGRTEENVVLDGRTGVDGDVILDFYVIPDDHVIRNVAVLAEDAFRTDPGPALDVAEMPDLGAFANFNIIVNVT